MKKFYLILPIIALLVASCQKEGTDEIISVQPIIKPPSEVITGSISGYVIDVDQLPIADALVSHNDDTAITNSEGLFLLEDINLFEDGSLLKVEKEGFFTGTKKFYASEDNVVGIQLSSKTFHDETNATSGGRVDINEAFVIFPSGAYSYSDNQKYSGNIRVFGKWINPIDRKDSYEMPGDLTGYDKDRNLRALICFSMLKIGIEDSSDEMIDLSSDQTATISFPIPTDLLQFAPYEIPLWYYDEPNGSWIQEGTAILDENRYVGEVSHISVWSCSVSLPAIDLSGSFHSNGSILKSKRLKLEDSQTGYVSYTTTNEDGYFNTKIPMGSVLEVQIESECSNGTLEHELGVFPESEKLGAIEILDDGSTQAEISGNLSDCDGGDLAATYLIIDIDGSKSMIQTANGLFAMGIPTNCGDSEIFITAINLETGNRSDEVSRAIEDEIDFSEIPLCTKIIAGYDVSYNTMNWSDELDNNVMHSWSILSISDSDKKKSIFTPRIVDSRNGQVYLSGAFVIIENSNGSQTATYELSFDSENFTISGDCEVSINPEGPFNSYRFFNNTTQQKLIGAEFADIGLVNFDLVYYD